MFVVGIINAVAKVREIKTADFDRVAELTNRFFPYTRSDREKIAERLQRGSVYFIAEVRKKVVGFIDIRIYEKNAKIIGIAVDDDYREIGIGSALIKKAFKFIRRMGRSSIFLRVERSNRDAINFYKNNGFDVRSDIIDAASGRVIYILEKKFEN